MPPLTFESAITLLKMLFLLLVVYPLAIAFAKFALKRIDERSYEIVEIGNGEYQVIYSDERKAKGGDEPCS